MHPLFSLKRFAFFWLVGLFMLAASTQSSAQPKPDRATEVTRNQVDALKQPTLLAAPLHSFMPQPAPIMLRGANAEDSLSVPISRRMQIRRAVLHLVATNSLSLLSPRSQLQIRLDGQVIAQIALDAKLPQIQARIELPLRLLKAGYNKLTFAVSQHYTLECEDPSAPELWTQIDTAQSWIALEGALHDIHPTLADLRDVLDPKLWGQFQLTVLAASGINDQVLRWGALASQAAALYLGYAPLQVRFAQAKLPAASPLAEDEETGLRLDPALSGQGDAMLVGTSAELRPYLSAALAERIRGPFLAIEPAPGSAGRYVVIASGPTAQDVDVALRALAIWNYPYPDASAAVVERMDLPKLPDNPGPRMVYPNQTLAFSQLGFKTASFAGLYGRQDLDLTLPADLFSPDNAMVRLKLRFAYGAGLREDSVLNILLNGRFQSAIALNSREGGHFRDYDVAIPLTSFKPGQNVLTFSAAMMPLVTGRCIAINTENLRLTLFDDSLLELPNAAHVTSLPNLDLLARSGFPYTQKPYGANTVFAIAQPDAAEAASAWMLAAKLAQIQKLPLLDARWQIGPHDLAAKGNAIVVGTAQRLPGTLTDALPLRLGAESVAPYPVEVTAAGPGEIGPLDRLWRWLLTKFNSTATSAAVPTVAWVTQNGIGLGKQAALMQAELPERRRGTLTVLTAAHDTVLLAQTDALIQPAVWSQLRGDVVLWQGLDQLASQMAGPSYTVGEAMLSSRIGFVLSQHPWFWGVVIGVLSLLLAALTLRLLMRFHHRRHARLKNSPDDQPPLV